MIEALRLVFVIVRREVRDQFRDWRILFPIVGLTLVFPFIMNWTAQQMLDFTSRYGATLIADRMVPFLLMIVGFFPISVSLVIALESFVGEKERNSIEPLLNSPLKDWQLYLGKLISSTVPPLVSSYLGMLVYLTGLILNHVTFPEPIIMVQVVVLTTVQAIMMVAGAVVVSTQATSVRAANLLSSFIVIPVAFLIQWESLVLFWGNIETLWWVVLGVVVFTILLVRIGMVHFQREELLGREIDVLKFRWIWGVFWQEFIGGAANPLDWYRRVLPRSVRGLIVPLWIVAGLVGLSLGLGASLVNTYPFLISADKLKDAGSSLSQLSQLLPVFQVGSIVGIWWQNVRVLLISMVLGVFTFGVLGVMPLMATMAISGYLGDMLSLSGVALLPILALFLPHGIFEIPAAMLATAAVLRAGAVLATPIPGKTIGEVWLATLANWLQLMIGIIMPLLVVAALIEVLVTPQIAILVLGR
jgi:uncharacterized membrane protein SpoIIM required for sporulation/ABC-type transport system involved in multi-copper enzyme maturation permease subunit